MRPDTGKTLTAVVLAMRPIASVSYQTLASEEPLNVIFILADDLGYSDTALHGTTDFYQTPNIERLAARGMTFNRAYANSPLCSPTRAGILTGQTPARHGSTRPGHHKSEMILKPTVESSAKPELVEQYKELVDPNSRQKSRSRSRFE
jgi:hypothetical protein